MFLFLAIIEFGFAVVAPQRISAGDEFKHQQYRVSAQVFIDGKLISSPKVMAIENEPVRIFQKGEEGHLDFSFTLNKQKTDSSNDFIVDAKLFYENNGKKISSNPQMVVVADSGEESTMEGGERANKKSKALYYKIVLKIDNYK